MNEKIAVVTGANRGLGFATSKALAEMGYKVFMIGRSAEKIQKAGQELKEKGLDVVAVPLDVCDEKAVNELAREIQAKHTRIATLINNAGIFPEKSPISIFDADIELVRNAFEVNTLGPLNMIKAFKPLLIKSRQARVVNVSSGMSGLEEMEGYYPAYRISKTALNAVTCMAAAELRDTNVKVNSVCPGWVRTDMGGEQAHRSIEEGIQGIIWAATLPNGQHNGKFLRDGEPIKW